MGAFLSDTLPLSQAGESLPPGQDDFRSTMNFHFDCVFYYVSDLEWSVRFYRDLLGLKLSSQDVVARFDIDGVLFEIVPAPEKTLPRHGGNGRLCLRVDNVEEALKELHAKSVRTGRAEPKANGVLGTFTDPDGNEICIWEYRSSSTHNRSN
jgi:catechol 2,3-dioxygenase-like lactoylglutathione lyase family enzyme